MRPMEPVDYEKVIADLESRRTSFNASIDAAIQAIRSVLAAGAGATATARHEPASNGGSLTPDMLFGRSIPEASMICLQVHKTPMSPREIVDALEAAKFHHQSKNFVNTLNSVLNRRAEVVGDVVKVGRSWALAEWYPGRRRTSKPAEQSPADSSADASNGDTSAA